MKMALATLALLILPVAAHAELPQEVLDADYKNCVGSDNDPKRAAFCACVGEGMKGWSQDQYVQASQEASASPKPDAAPASIQEIAKKCMAQVLD